MPIPLGILAVAGAGAAGGASSFDLLETTLISTNTASVTFSGLGSYSDYKHLEIRWTARTNMADDFDELRIRLNSDTGSNYNGHQLQGSGSSVASAGGSTLSYTGVASLPGNTSTANAFASGVTSIADFSSSSKNTTLRTLAGRNGTFNLIRLASGLWNNTAAVTTILLYPGSGNFVSGSRFSLYGIK